MPHAANLNDEPSATPASIMRVLVVDDNEASAKTLGWAVEMLGHEVRLAANGPDAIELARTLVPNVVLLDIGLPRMNGYEVCQHMRSDVALKDTVFIAQTGWGQEHHRKLSKEAGFDYHLVKPIDLVALQRLLDSLSQSPRGQASA